MIRPIPGQPINFGDLDSFACEVDKPIPLLVDVDDHLVFQIAREGCAVGAEHITGLPDAGSLNGWQRVGPWSINDQIGSPFLGDYCITSGNANAFLVYPAYAPVVGTLYTITLDVSGIGGGGILLEVGGQSFSITTPGVHVITFTAAATDYVRISNVDDASFVCLRSASLYSENRSITVEIVQDGDVVVASYDIDTAPELFTYIGSTVIFDIRTGATGLSGGCFTIRVVDGCEDPPSSLCSQAIEILGDCDGTHLFRTCVDSPQFGFEPGYFNVRLRASMLRPAWEWDIESERLSNGFINQHFVDVQKVFRLDIEPVDGLLHPHLAAWPLFDHLYINEVEYVVDGGNYAPTYDDRIDSGGVSLNVREKMRLQRRVNCAPIGEGCNPINDPVCQLPGIQFNERIANDGGFYVDVVYYSNLGFVPGVMQVDIDGVPLAPVTLVAFGTFSYGPYAPGQTFDVSVTNDLAPLCPYVHPTITANTGCPPGGIGRGSIVWVSAISLGVTTTTGFATLRYATGAQFTASAFLPTPGAACLWSSDAAGTQAGSVTRINANNGVTFIDVTEFDALEKLEVYTGGMSVLDLSANPLLEDLRIESNSLASLDLSANPLLEILYLVAPLTTIDLSAQPGLLILTLLAPPILSIDLSANTAIADLTLQAGINALDLTGFLALRTLNLACPALTSVTIPAAAPLRSVVADGAALDATSVDAICNALTAATTGQASSIVGGTSAAPTAASLTARNNYIAAGNTLVTN